MRVVVFYYFGKFCIVSNVEYIARVVSRNEFAFLGWKVEKERLRGARKWF
jgi:hypothetical protein